MARAFLLALLAALNPTLLGATTVMLVLADPARLMLGYLLGALMTSITLGLVIVFSLEGTSAVSTTQNAIGPGVDIALGLAAILGAHFLARAAARRGSAPAPAKPKAPPRWQTRLSGGSARSAFVVGALLTLPGASYLAGLRQIDGLNYSTPATVVAVVGFNLVMLVLLELPLLGFVVAPDWTKQRVTTARAQVSRHGQQIAVSGLRLIGAALILKGIVAAITG